MIHPVAIVNKSNCNVASIMCSFHPVPKFRKHFAICLLSLTVHHRIIAIFKRKNYIAIYIVHLLKLSFYAYTAAHLRNLNSSPMS